MPKARIHFVRHAETLYNVNGQLQGWSDSPLTQRGERQAAALGERLRTVPLATAFTSDLARTRTTTAAALIGHPHLSSVEMHELREWHFGEWEGKQNTPLWERVFRDHGYSYVPSSLDWPLITTDGYDTVIDSVHRHDPSGRAETSAEVRRRLAEGLDIVVAAAAAGAGDVLVVTHGAVLGSILRYLVPEYVLPSGFPNCGMITLSWHEDQAFVGEVDKSCALSGQHV